MRRTAVCVAGLALLLWGGASALAGAEATPAAAPAPAATPAPEEPPLTPQEKEDAETGKKAAAEIEKEAKVLDKYEGLPHLQEVVERLRPFTAKPRQKYTVKVIDNKSINAFSLPGGYIYFTKGLLDAVESDDELAAVAAHEMGHICLDHARRLNERDARYSRYLGPLVLAAILGQKSGVNPGEVAAVGALIKMDAVNQYGQEAEKEADNQAVKTLYTSKLYSPVAVLTVMEGLARLDSSQPEVREGVFQTHPRATERIQEITKQLAGLHVPIERGRVRKGLTATSKPVTVNGTEIGELRLDEQLVFQPAVKLGDLSPAARAQQSADLLNPLLLSEMPLFEISSEAKGDTVVIQARGQTLLTITPGDAAFHQTTVEALAQRAMKAIQTAYYVDHAKRAY